MKDQKSLLRNTPFFVGSIVALSLLSILMRTLCLLFFFDTEIGYYTAGAWLPYLAGGILLVAALLFGVASFTLFAKAPLAPTQPALPSRICAGLVVLAFLYSTLSDLFSKGSPILLLFGLGTVAYFVLITLGVSSPIARLIGCVCAMLRLLSAMAGSYFDATIPMNAPDKVLFELACVVCALFLVSDLRATLSEPRPALYRFSLAMATLLLGTASIPSLIGLLSQTLSGEEMLPSYLFLLALFLYALARTLELLSRPRATENGDPDPTPTDVDATND